MNLSPEAFDVLIKGYGKEKLEILDKICPEDRTPELIDLLIKLLDDPWDNNFRGSAFGPTYIDPDKDLPVAIKARELLVSFGPKVVPPVLKLMDTHASEPRHYYAVQILGALQAKEALPIFEKLILDWRKLYVRVNFDQEDNFEISLAAYKAYLNTDKDACKKFIASILDNSYFEKHPDKLYYKKSLLYYLKEWNIASDN